MPIRLRPTRSARPCWQRRDGACIENAALEGHPGEEPRLIEAKGHAAQLTPARLLAMYELMVTGRLLETRLHTMYRGGRLPGAVYPGVGQEAAQGGFISALEPGDVFGPPPPPPL